MSALETLKRGALSSLGGMTRYLDPLNMIGREQTSRLARGMAHEMGPGTVMAAPGLYAMGAGAVGAMRDRGSEQSQGFGKDFVDNMQFPRDDLEMMRNSPVVSGAVQRYHDALESGDQEMADTMLRGLEHLGVDPRGRSSMQFVRKVDDWGRDVLDLEDQTTAEEAASVIGTAFVPLPRPGLIGSLAARMPRGAQTATHVAGRVAEVTLPGSSPYTPVNVGANAAVPLALGEALTRASGDEDGFVGPMLEAVTQQFDDIMSPIMQWEPPARDPDAAKTANHVTGYDMWLADPEGDD